MSRDPRPWWASDGDATVTDPVDPVQAHRAARRGQPRTDDPATWWDPDALFGVPDPPTDERDRARAGTDGAPAGDPAHGPDVCGVCPICLGLRALGETRPQLLEHLTEAARHLAAAVRSIVDEDPRPRGDSADRGRATDPLERIDLD